MTQKSLGYVELQWTCPNCESRVPGTQKTCGSCGSPQPANVQFEQSVHAELIQDAGIIESAKKGADVHCPYCGTRNPADAEICGQCGGDLKQGLKREVGTVVGAYSTQPKPVQPIPCPNCNAQNPDTRDTCVACGANLRDPSSRPATQEAVPAKPASPGRNKTMIAIGIALGVIVLACIIYFAITLNRRQDLSATVQAVNWSRVIAIQELRDASYSGWINQIPSDAAVGDCDKREYETLSSPPSAGEYQEVCGTPYTKDTGSGLGEVVQDCQFVVYQDYCDYIVQEWQVVDQVQLQGSDLNPEWPVVDLANQQRQGESKQTYTVTFTTDKGPYIYTISNFDEYAEFNLGSQWLLILNGFDQIVSVEPR